MEGKDRLVLMAALLLLAIVPAHCDDTAKPVSTVLRASWPDTPLLLEARYIFTKILPIGALGMHGF